MQKFKALSKNSYVKTKKEYRKSTYMFQKYKKFLKKHIKINVSLAKSGSNICIFLNCIGDCPHKDNELQYIQSKENIKNSVIAKVTCKANYTYGAYMFFFYAIVIFVLLLLYSGIFSYQDLYVLCHLNSGLISTYIKIKKVNYVVVKKCGKTMQLKRYSRQSNINRVNKLTMFSPFGKRQQNPILFSCKLGKYNVQFEYDTGAFSSIIDKITLQRSFPKFKGLTKIKAHQLYGVTGNKLNVIAAYLVPLMINNQEFILPLNVIDRKNIFLIGRDSIHILKSSLIYNDELKQFQLNINSKGKNARMVNVKCYKFKPFESKILTFKLKNVPNDSYFIKKPNDRRIKIKLVSYNQNLVKLWVKNDMTNFLTWSKPSLHLIAVKTNIEPKRIHLIDKKFVCVSKESIDEAIKEEEISDDQFLDLLDDNIPGGVDIGRYLYNPQKSKEQYMQDIECKNEYMKEKIVEYYLSSNVVAQSELDSGKIHEKVPKLDLHVKKGFKVPRNTKAYKLSYVDNMHVEVFFQYLLAYGIAEIPKHQNYFGSPVFLLPRTSVFRPARPLVDLRKVNKVIQEPANSAVPDFFNLLKSMLPNIKYISCLDLKQAFYSLSVTERMMDSGLNNVLCGSGAYTLTRALTGMSAIPGYLLSIFQEYLHKNEKGLWDFYSFLLSFFDDLNIISFKGETIEDHTEKVLKVLKRLNHLNLRIGDLKCIYGIDLEVETVKIFGYDVGKNSISIPQKRIQGLLNLEEPNSQKALQSFLGILGFYRNLLSLDIHQSMNILYKYIYPFSWDEKASKAFKQIMSSLKENVHSIKGMHSKSVNLLLTDGSAVAVGGVLINFEITHILDDIEIETQYKPPLPFFSLHPNIEVIATNKSLIWTVYFMAKKLLYTTNTLDHFITSIYQNAYMNLDFAEFLEFESDKFDALKEFLAKVPDPQKLKSCTFKDPFLFSYTLKCLSNVFQSTIIIVVPYKNTYRKLKVGHYEEELGILYENEMYFGLYSKNSSFIKNTIPYFNSEILHSTLIKSKFFDSLRKWPAEQLRKKCRVIGYFSKAISPDLLKKSGVAYIETIAILYSLCYFETEIKGRFVYILSDSASSIHCLKAEFNNTRNSKLDRISQKLLFWFKNHNMFFIHIEGKHNLADFVSRLVALPTVKFQHEVPKPIYESENFKVLPIRYIQKREDMIYRNGQIKQVKYDTPVPKPLVIEEKLFEKLFNKKNFIQQQIAMENVPNINPGTLKFLKNKLMVPKAYYLLFVCAMHKFLGHIGKEKLANYFKAYYYVEKRKLINRYIELVSDNCMGCLASKPKKHKYERGSVHMSNVTGPNQLLTGDCLDTPYGFDPNFVSMLVLKDVFSHYTTIFLVPSLTQENIKLSFTSYFTIHGPVHAVLLDNAKYFRGEKISKFFDEMGVKVMDSSPRKSSSRGYIERANQSILTLYRILNAHNTEGQEKYNSHKSITLIAHALNSIPYKNSKLTPFNIHFNSYKNFNGNLLNAYENFFRSEFIHSSLSLDQRYEKERLEYEELVFKIREEFLSKEYQALKKKNKRRYPHKFKKGDYVIIKKYDVQKFKPLFGLMIYKVYKAKKHVLYLQNLSTDQLIHRHPTHVKKISMKKLGLYELPQEYIDSFEILTLDAISELYDIPLPSDRQVQENSDDSEGEEGDRGEGEGPLPDPLNSQESLLDTIPEGIENESL